MKTDNVSFGISYVKPSIRYMSKQNQEKVKSIIPLGQLYPVDMFIGSNIKGDLTLDIVKTPMHKFLAYTDEIPKTFENLCAMDFASRLETKYLATHEELIPLSHYTIKNLKNYTKKDLPYAVHEKILEYFNTIGKIFVS